MRRVLAVINDLWPLTAQRFRPRCWRANCSATKEAPSRARDTNHGAISDGGRGTLFLDEIGDMPLELQPKLLRALQEREFERLGSAQTVRVNVRVIAATNQDLGQLVTKKLFRADFSTD